MSKKPKKKAKAKTAREYESFLSRKTSVASDTGIQVAPDKLNAMLYPFQKDIVSWALRKGRGAIFADCGLGKTPMQLEWADHIARHTNRRVLILTPLAVGEQTVREGDKFSIPCTRSRDGKWTGDAKIIVTNYEQLHHFSPGDFGGCVCDESSILKNFDGVRRAAITDFMRTIQYRLLCTATAAPNDYIELGTSSEALGDMGYMDMLGKFFKGNNGSLHPLHSGHQRRIQQARFVFRGHAEHDFWRWVCSWARALRKPSDWGYDDGEFTLPDLNTRQHVVTAVTPREGYLFNLPAITLQEQRSERRRTLKERCGLAASLVSDTGLPAICWCHLNCEGDTLARLIPDAEQVSGKDPDEKKEELLTAFQRGELRVIVTKPSIAGFGLNWQHCAHQTFFPSHSYEQWYQAVRRSWRFGQKRPVTVDVITSEGERYVLDNLLRKERAATEMFNRLVRFMGDEMNYKPVGGPTGKEKVPAWL